MHWATRLKGLIESGQLALCSALIALGISSSMASGPYIRRDGQVNPARDTEEFATTRFDRMSSAVEALGLAYYFTDDPRYAQTATDVTQLLIPARLPLVHTADAPEDIQAVFAKGMQLLESGHYAEAVPLFKDVTSRAPEAPGAFMNLGLAAAESGDRRLALRAWLRYHEMVPNDTKVFGKLIQTYQALGQLKERDRVRDQLIAYRNSLPPEQRESFAFYVRDQFDVAGQHIIVLEYFEPKSPMRLYYKFTAVDINHKALYNFTFTSSDSETAAARELGRIGKDDRMYGLDKNEGGKSTLYDLLTTVVSYDDVRSLVIGAMEGRSRFGAKQ